MDAIDAKTNEENRQMVADERADKLRKLSAVCEGARLNLERSRLRANEAEFNLGIASGGRPAIYYELVTRRIGG